MNVSIIGQGYVGLTLAMNAGKAKYNVIGFDTNKSLVKDLKLGRTYINGISSSQIIELIDSGNYLPTSDPHDLSHSEVVIIAVPTPLDQARKPDLGSLNSAIDLIAEFVKHEALIINESTSYPGTLRELIMRRLDRISNQKFQYASAPERVDPGNPKWTVENTPRLICGMTDSATQLAYKFYSKFCNHVVVVASPEVAETAKLFENTFRQVNIALVNELSLICDKLSISTHEVINSAASKPFGFMPFYPSIGVGGHCIPVDPSYLSFRSEQIGVVANFINLSNKLNIDMPSHVARRIEAYLGGNLKQKLIQLVGISYKANVSDLRESPAIRLIEELENLGAKVIWHDPLVQVYKDTTSLPLNIQVDLGIIISPHDIIDFTAWLNSDTSVIDLSPTKNNYGWPKFL